MRILLISPGQDKGYRRRLGGWTFSFPQLTLAAVAALTPPDIEISIIDEQVEEIDYEARADLVGITAMTAVAPRAYKIARAFRLRGIKVVIGGMHATVLPHEAIEHCDSVVIGEAEGSWQRLIADFRQNNLQRFYSNSELPSLKGIPEPRRDLFKKGAYWIKDTIQLSRGCPYNCSFCSVTKFFGSRFRLRPVEEVVHSIKKMKAKFVGFVDDNIVGNLPYAAKLFKALIPLKIRWASQASVNVARDKNILELAQKSGCVGLFLGFESISQDAMNEVGKPINKIDEYAMVVRRLHHYGITLMGAFIFGFDSDDKGVFERTLQFVRKINLDLVQFGLLTPFPGTSLRENLEREGRIIHNDWSKYDIAHVVFHPKQMSAEELYAGSSWALRQFYSSSSIFKRMLKLELGFFKNILHSIPVLMLNLGYQRALKFSDNHPEEK